jgi:hypothetical protein
LDLKERIIAVLVTPHVSLKLRIKILKHHYQGKMPHDMTVFIYDLTIQTVIFPHDYKNSLGKLLRVDCIVTSNSWPFFYMTTKRVLLRKPLTVDGMVTGALNGTFSHFTSFLPDESQANLDEKTLAKKLLHIY